MNTSLAYDNADYFTKADKILKKIGIKSHDTNNSLKIKKSKNFIGTFKPLDEKIRIE